MYYDSATPSSERQPSSEPVSDTDSVKTARRAAAVIDGALQTGDQQAYQELLSCFHTVSAGGLSAWQADVEWWDDPVSAVGEGTLRNEVVTTVHVEVIRVGMLLRCM
jgi:hypothetical protein